jgi:20S proteasome subunit alpha 2
LPHNLSFSEHSSLIEPFISDFRTMSERYGFSLTTFSPSGKLVQIEYALNAVNAGSPAVGIKASNGVVLATEKKSKSLLHDDRTVHKVEPICKSMGLVYSGMGPDYRYEKKKKIPKNNYYYSYCINRLLVQKARKLAQEYMLVYEQNVPPTQLVKRVADVMQEYTQSGFVKILFFQKIYL